MMSDDERDIDIESDEADDYLDSEPRGSGSWQGGGQFATQNVQAEKRAHHNALERKRRDHIKDSFSSLRDSVPALHGEKTSRAQILKKAADYIHFMRRKNSAHHQDIDDLKRQNNKLESQIQSLEKARATGDFAVAAASEASHLKTMTGSGNSSGSNNNGSIGGGHSKTDSGSSRESESDVSDSGSSSSSRRSKRQKTILS